VGVASSLDSSVRLRIALGVLLALGALGLSVAARLGSPGHAADATPVHDLDAPRSETVGASGALLLDLDDDLSDDQRAALAQAIDDAVAPFDWPDGTLGVELSAAGRLYRLNIPDSELADLRRSLRGQGAVESLEREHVLGLPVDPRAIDFTPNDGGDAADAPASDTVAPARGAFRPNDPYYRHQWHLDQVQMPHAWLRTRGRGVVVAVIDTGVLYRDHERGRRAPDLAGTRFAPGWDFVDRDATPDDEHGHGTHVAGTIAQSTHNAIGVAGVAPDATIMPIRVLDARGAGRSGDIAAAIRWAAGPRRRRHQHEPRRGPAPRGPWRRPSSTPTTRAWWSWQRPGTPDAAAWSTQPRTSTSSPWVRSAWTARAPTTPSYGDALDLMAPGGDLRVDQNGDGMPDGVVQNTMVRGDPMQHDYLGFQGTSMAAPPRGRGGGAAARGGAA
jgi:serine protease